MLATPRGFLRTAVSRLPGFGHAPETKVMAVARG